QQPGRRRARQSAALERRCRELAVTDSGADPARVAAAALGAVRDRVCVAYHAGSRRSGHECPYRVMQRRPGGARVDRSGRVPRLAVAAPTRSVAVRARSGSHIQARLMPNYAMRSNRPAACVAGLLLALGGILPAAAHLRMGVPPGVPAPWPIAIAPSAHASPADGGLDVAQVIQHDLEGSGRFRALARGRMPATPTQPAAVVTADWK